MMGSTAALLALATGGLTAKAAQRLSLSRAKHPSLRGHSKWSRRVAKLVRYFEYGPDRWFDSDLAPADIAGRRRRGLEALVSRALKTSPRTLAYAQSLENSVSDVRFTSYFASLIPVWTFYLARTLSK